MKRERVVENLNRALLSAFARDPRVLLLGEDILDPYGGAFKVTRGLSTKYPDRALATPLSEETIVGMAGGLALCGEKPIVELMFGDFIALAFDQILNFASKSVTMYGRKLDLNMVVRCPVGGHRSYGPTHSQSPQKHFVGIPNLDLYELSPFHDNEPLLERLLNLGHPAILFEDKILYTQHMLVDGRVDDLFAFDYLGLRQEYARIHSPTFERAAYVIIAAGALVSRCVAAARRLLIERELEGEILVPSRLFPLNIDPIVERVRAADAIVLVEDGPAGGGWSAELAVRLYDRLWPHLKHPIRTLAAAPSIIPSATHLEKEILVQADDIFDTVQEAAA